MNEQVETQPGLFDMAKLALAIMVLAGGIVAFYTFGDLAPVVRWLIVLAAAGLGGLVAMQSSYGRDFWHFVQLARVELRKVVWPTTTDTWRTTAVVFAFVVVMGFFFWGLDFLLAWASKQLTGQGS